MNIFENIHEISCSLNLEVAINYIVFLAGFVLFAIWLNDTSFGRKALEDSRPRRNNMPVFLPLVVFFGIFLSISLLNGFVLLFTEKFQEWQKVLTSEIVNTVARLVSIGVILFIVKKCFARGTKGFGLNFRTIPKDFIFAIVYLIAILPLIYLMLEAVVYINELYKPDYKIPTHEELKILTENPKIIVRLAIAIGTILVVPFFEEMIFRGLFQSMIRSTVYFYKQAAWIAILFTSLLFAVTHADISHWPVLFILSMAMGYSYEKSGSLFRSVFIHMLFNASAIITTWIS